MYAIVARLLRLAAITLGVGGISYMVFIAALTRIWLQTHVIYLHALQMTWFKDLDRPEAFGFLYNQVSPFRILASDRTPLYVWHILPIGLYSVHEQRLVTEKPGFISDFKSRLSYRLLREPEAHLVIHLHGAGGTVGSGYRVPNYRALSASHPDKIHVLTFDYRGFGRSPGIPTEKLLIEDAIAVVQWALHDAKMSPARIIIFGQSLGTAVNVAVARHFALRDQPIIFAGHILVAPFTSAIDLVSTYRIAGLVPLLAPLRRVPKLFRYLTGYIRDTWLTKDRITDYVRANDTNRFRFQITILHAENDYDVPYTHTIELAKYAVGATGSIDEVGPADRYAKAVREQAFEHASRITEYDTGMGLIRTEIVPYGRHNVIMADSIIPSAVMRTFARAERDSITVSGTTPLL